jgi:hypothetical protein
MNKHRVWTMTAMLVAANLALSACKIHDGASADTTPAGPPGTPAVTAVGNPDGAQTSKTIGAAGGSLTSSDGRLRLDVPAGALAANTSIAILPISNAAPGGLGDGFRLTPNGLNFATPAKLTYTPAAGELGGGAAPGLAFQTGDHGWQIVSGVTPGAVAGTYSASISHFTDYSFWNGVFITGHSAADSKTAAFTGKNFQLEVREYDPPAKNAGGFFVLVSSSHPYTTNNCCVWLVNDAPGQGGNAGGDLAPLGNAATYTTPAHLPPKGKNPVKVSAGFTTPAGQQITLFRKIHVLAHQYKIALTLVESTKCLATDAGLAPTYNFTSTANVLLTLDNSFNISGSGFNTLNTPPEVSALNTCDPAKWGAQWLSAQTHDTSITAASGSYSEAQRKLHFDLAGQWSDTPPLRITSKQPPPSSFDTNENRSDLANLGFFFYFDGIDGEVVDAVFSSPTNRNSTDYGFAVSVTKE